MSNGDISGAGIRGRGGMDRGIRIWVELLDVAAGGRVRGAGCACAGTATAALIAPTSPSSAGRRSRAIRGGRKLRTRPAIHPMHHPIGDVPTS